MTRSAKVILRISLIILLTFFGCLFFPRRTVEGLQAQKPQAPAAAARAGSTAKPGSRAPSARLQTLRNVGKAYYEQAKYVEAIEEFKKVLATGTPLATDHLDMGLALMQASKLDEALGELTTAKQMDPHLTAADYNLGILYKRELRYPDAEAALKRVIAADPNDPAAWFNLGTVYSAQKKLEDAFDAHQHVVQMGFGRGQNFYVASLFHSFTALVRLKRQEEAQRFLKIHEKMRDLVPGISLQNPALEGGKYGAILVPASPTTTVARGIPPAAAFADITAKLGIQGDSPGALAPADAWKDIPASDFSLDFARRNLLPRFGPSVAVGDYDGDSRPDVYLVNSAGVNRLFHNNKDGTFSEATESGVLAGPQASLSARFVDYDNSDRPSLFVAGEGGVRLYRNQGNGAFADETEKAGLKVSPGGLSAAAALFDGDNDGFLDLVVTTYTDLNAAPKQNAISFPADFPAGSVRYYHNNANGTFTEATAASGLGALKGRWRRVLFADFDNDGYTDILLVRDDGPPLIFFGRGEGKFVNRTPEAGADLTRAIALGAQVADFNHDGYFDIVLWTASGYRVLLNRGGGRFEAVSGLPAVTPPAGLYAFRGTVADLDGDSFEDLLVADAGGKLHFIANRGGKFQEADLKLPGNGEILAAMVPTWLGSPGKLNLVAVTRRAQLRAFEKEGPPARWLEVKMTGYKSNSQGIGSVLEFKAGNFYNKVLVTSDRVRVYAGDLPELDVVRVTWPNAVIQNWVNIATNKPLEVRESERLATSCPFVYIWNGAKFVFLTDVLGTAPLGELLPDGSYIKPFPEEFVRLPEALRDQNGDYVFQFTDELREVDFFDQIRLVAVDHPAAEDVFANEIYSSNPPAPSLYVVRGERLPISAVDDRGNDVLPLVRAADGRYPTDFRRQRILGLADLHSLTLDLGDVPAASRLALWLTGWVYWTDSNASRALATNSQSPMIPPYLQVRDARGRWVTVIEDMGLPSGTDRTMRVDLTGKFLSADRHVRIVTNFCVYWDRIFFTTEDSPASQRAELPLLSADLHYRGFSTPASDPSHKQPDRFDYSKVMAEAPWNPMIGNYTRYGDTGKLVSAADDQLVVMATGDELTVRFDGHALPPLPAGWKRSFFLYTHGWAKDGEPNTAYSKTVAPMPFRGMSNYPYRSDEHYPESIENQRYLREYQIRPRYLLIPPLAPVH
ncbi:MAG: FG-GAP-like repeat-containing protein [Acidobacteriia bacterium]|nr:FG-GAP-like repeat-containing protein [Terriglobia bacterium]